MAKQKLRDMSKRQLCKLVKHLEVDLASYDGDPGVQRAVRNRRIMKRQAYPRK